MLNSLRNRIIFAFGLIIVAAIVMSTLVAIWSAEHQLEEFVSDISLKQATGLTGIVEVEYNLKGNLDSISTTIQKQSLTLPRRESLLPDYDAEAWQAIVSKFGVSNPRSVATIMQSEMESFNDSIDFTAIVDRWYQVHAFVYGVGDSKDLRFDKSAVYLLNSNFTIRYRGHDEGSGERHSDEESGSEEHHFSIPFYDWSSGDLVGYIVTEGQDEFSDESSEFTQGTFTNTLYGGLITAILAFGIAIWLASRINAPVKALTRAANQLAESGEPERIKVHSNDELGRMSAAFNQMADTIQTQQQIRRQLITDLSHELNTPLSIIRLEAKGMVDGMQAPQEAAANIQREIDLLHGLFTDLELIAEADQNAIQLAKEPVVLVDFLKEVIGRWQSKANLQGIQFQLEAKPAQSTFTFDPNRMGQVLSNLLRNALQHTEKDGRITVTAEASSTDLTITVQDTGPGIAAEHLPYIFDRFYHLDETQQRTLGGRGLGLAIVKQLVELHNGRVWVDSELGIGSRFFVSIPNKE